MLSAVAPVADPIVFPRAHPGWQAAVDGSSTPAGLLATLRGGVHVGDPGSILATASRTMGPGMSAVLTRFLPGFPPRVATRTG